MCVSYLWPWPLYSVPSITWKIVALDSWIGFWWVGEDPKQLVIIINYLRFFPLDLTVFFFLSSTHKALALTDKHNRCNVTCDSLPNWSNLDRRRSRLQYTNQLCIELIYQVSLIKNEKKKTSMRKKKSVPDSCLSASSNKRRQVRTYDHESVTWSIQGRCQALVYIWRQHANRIPLSVVGICHLSFWFIFRRSSGCIIIFVDRMWCTYFCLFVV